MIGRLTFRESALVFAKGETVCEETEVCTRHCPSRPHLNFSASRQSTDSGAHQVEIALKGSGCKEIERTVVESRRDGQLMFLFLPSPALETAC
jgi:hypothetical protein